MKIEVGEYVRTKEGYIAKLIKTNEQQHIFDNSIRDIRGLIYDKDMFLWNREIKEYIEKHSFNIIDLIEEGDYVNERKVKYIRDYEDYKRIDFDDDMDDTIYEEQIYSIVTKQQFESMEYKI